jgi:hypothetical protein
MEESWRKERLETERSAQMMRQGKKERERRKKTKKKCKIRMNIQGTFVTESVSFVCTPARGCHGLVMPKGIR